MNRRPSTGDDFVDALRLWSPGFQAGRDDAGHSLVNRAAEMRSSPQWMRKPTRDPSDCTPVSGEIDVPDSEQVDPNSSEE